METAEIKKLIERIDYLRNVNFRCVKDGNYYKVECADVTYLTESQAKDLVEGLNEALQPSKVAAEKELKKKLAVFV